MMLTTADERRIHDLHGTIWDDVFELMGREPDLTGDDAGRIAAAAARAARDELERLWECDHAR